jgi:hypothetical protein
MGLGTACEWSGEAGNTEILKGMKEWRKISRFGVLSSWKLPPEYLIYLEAISKISIELKKALLNLEFVAKSVT